MRKQLFIIGLLFLVMVFVAYMLPKFMSFSSYKPQIEQAIYDEIGVMANIRGDIEVKFLPYPQITIAQLYLKNQEDLALEDQVSVQQLSFSPTFFSLFSGNIRPSSITLYKAQLYSKFVEKIIVARANKEGESLKTIKLISSSLALKIAPERDGLRLTRMNLELELGDRNTPYELEGNAVVNGQMIAFEGELGGRDEDKLHSNVTLEADFLKLEYQGEVSVHDEGFYLAGVMESKITDLSAFTKRHLVNQYPSLANIASGETVTMSSKVKLQQNIFELNDLVIAGKSFDLKGALLSTKGEADLTFLVQKIDMDSLMESSSKKSLLVDSRKVTIYNDPIWIKKTTLYIDGEIKEFVLNKQTMRDIRVEADTFNSVVTIHHLSAKLPGTGAVEVLGTITHNGIRPRFEGGLKVNGKNFSDILLLAGVPRNLVLYDSNAPYILSGDISMTSSKVDLSRVDLSLGESLITGGFTIRRRNEIPKVIAKLNFSKLNIDRMFEGESIENLRESLTQDTARGKGWYSWLTRMNVNATLDVNINELHAKEHVYRNTVLSLLINPGELKINELAANAKYAQFDASLHIDTNRLRPTVNLKFDAKRLSDRIFQSLSPKRVKDDTGEMSLENLEIPEEEVAQFEWPDYTFNFFGLDQVDGKIDLTIDNLRYKRIDFKNVALKGTLQDRYFMIEDFKASTGSSGLRYSGNLGLDSSPSLTGSFSLANFQIQKFFKIFNIVPSMKGYFSLSGSFATHGKNLKSWVKNLQSMSLFAGRELEVKGIDLLSMIDAVPEMNSSGAAESIAEQSLEGGVTKIAAIDSRVVVAKGIVSTQNFTITMARATGVSHGVLDLPNLSMNAISKFAFIPQGDIRPIHFTITTKGELSALEKTIDSSQLQDYVTDPRNFNPEGTGSVTAAPRVEDSVQPNQYDIDNRPQPVLDRSLWGRRPEGN